MLAKACPVNPRHASTIPAARAIQANWDRSAIASASISTTATPPIMWCQNSKAGLMEMAPLAAIGRYRLVTTAPAAMAISAQNATRMALRCSQGVSVFMLGGGSIPVHHGCEDPGQINEAAGHPHQHPSQL